MKLSSTWRIIEIYRSDKDIYRGIGKEHINTIKIQINYGNKVKIIYTNKILVVPWGDPTPRLPHDLLTPQMLKGKLTPPLLCKHKLHAGKHHAPLPIGVERVSLERKNNNYGKWESNPLLSNILLFIYKWDPNFLF